MNSMDDFQTKAIGFGCTGWTKDIHPLLKHLPLDWESSSNRINYSTYVLHVPVHTRIMEHPVMQMKFICIAPSVPSSRSLFFFHWEREILQGQSEERLLPIIPLSDQKKIEIKIEILNRIHAAKYCCKKAKKADQDWSSNMLHFTWHYITSWLMMCGMEGSFHWCRGTRVQ